MDRIRVCVGSNDGVTIAKSHMGDAEYFCIYDVLADSDCVLIDKRRNTARDTDETHASREKMKQILDIIDDVDVLVARQKSPNFRAIARSTRYQPVVVRVEAIDEALVIMRSSFPEVESYVVRRRDGEVFEEMPEISAPSVSR